MAPTGMDSVVPALERASTPAAPGGIAGRVAHRGRIGPNAIIRVAESLEARLGPATRQDIFTSAGLAVHLRQAPADMVPEEDVAWLQCRLYETLGSGMHREITRDAGLRTGNYLLAHRIPRPAQAILRRIPSALAARLLARAIGGHAWTFAGSGTFAWTSGYPFRFAVAGCPLCRHIRATRPACDYYAATFECIFRELVSPRSRVIERACQAAGASACTFEVTWKDRQDGAVVRA